MWMAQINGLPDDEWTVHNTAAEAVEAAATWQDENLWEEGPDGELELEVYWCERMMLPSIGAKVPDLIEDAWGNNAPESAPDLEFTDEWRKGLAAAVDALVREWAVKADMPNCWEQVGAPALTAKLAWARSMASEACEVDVPDDVWAAVLKLDEVAP
jgi:hypothetical protein